MQLEEWLQCMNKPPKSSMVDDTQWVVMQHYHVAKLFSTSFLIKGIALYIDLPFSLSSHPQLRLTQ
jgi:hypothetical protein